MTGVEVSLAILAEFIGGSMFPGNALAMNYMKAYGFVTAQHAISFSQDLKLAHYAKVSTRLESILSLQREGVWDLETTVEDKND